MLDRCKEPGAEGEPLYKDVLVALAENMADETPHFAEMPKVIGGRYGLGSKEFNPAMISAVFSALTALRSKYPWGATGQKRRFTVGIADDVTGLSLSFDPAFRTDATQETFAAVFYGLGSDGTVSANKNSIKIIGDETELYAQGYFVYDSKKSGAMTVSHLRFGPQPIRSAYLTGDGDAKFIACHQPLVPRNPRPAGACCAGGGFPAQYAFVDRANLGHAAGQDAAPDDRKAHPVLHHRRLSGRRRKLTWAGASIP